MTKNEAYSSWLYFCSLVNRFENTIHYVDHSVDSNGELHNKNVFSNEFYTILFLSCSEFEVVSKCICVESGIIVTNNANIVELSDKILQKYPNIVQTEIESLYHTLLPLKDWKVINKQVQGLKWWKAYGNLKHNRYNHFDEASLENCLYSLASLMILELYLQKIVCGNTDNTRNRMINYFTHKYSYAYMITEGGTRLPDF